MIPDSYRSAIGEAAPPDPLAEMFDTFTDIERDLNAHGLAIDGIHPWSAWRREIFEDILVRTGTMMAFQTKPLPKQKQVAAITANLALRNPLLRHRPAHNLIVPWGRTQNVNGRAIDILSARLRDRLPRDATLQLDINRDFATFDWSACSSDAIGLVSQIGAKARPSHPGTRQKAQLEALERAIESAFSVRLPLTHQLTALASSFRVRRTLTARLLRRWDVRNIFVVVAYGHPMLTAAAHDVGARVIEMQHGLISRYLVAYDFPEGIEPAYAPDVILTFGAAWNDAARLPARTKPIVLGAPHIRDRLDAVPHAAERAPHILFLSQPTICDALLDFALRFAALPNAPKVLFRLHPGDDVARAQEKLRGADPARIELSTGGGGARTLEIQASSHAQIGVFSTAVVEGLACGCRTFIAPLPGRSSMTSLLDKGFGELARDPADLLHRLRTGDRQPAAMPPLDLFFAHERPEALAEAMA